MSGPSRSRATAAVRRRSSIAGSGWSRIGMPGFRAEVLDDDLLDVPVALVEIADREQRLDALRVGLADADENARGEGDRQLAGERDGPEAPSRHLVGGAVVGEARAEQPLRGRLEHDAHADVDLAERREVTLAHHARIGVGQEARLADDQRRDRAQVVERRPVPHAPQELAVLGEERLRPVAQREERFLGAEALARAGERQDLLRRHGQRARVAGIAPEGAVPAVVAAEIGQRYEDLGREGHAAAAAPVPRRRRCGEQVGHQRRGGREEGDRLLRGGCAAPRGALDRG